MPTLTKGGDLPVLPNVGDPTRAGQQRKALPWQEIATAVAGPLKQICGPRQDGQRMLEATLRNVPIREDEPFPGLPCVAFSLGGIMGASQSFMDLSGSPLEELLGADLKRAPLHGLLPMAQNKRLNLEAWSKLELLHSRTFAGASRLKASRRAVVADGLEVAATAVEVTEEEEEEIKSVTVSLLLSPMRQGKPFWNLVSAFTAEVFREILVVHVLMPISATVPSILWQEDNKASSSTPGPGPIPELLPYVDSLMNRLRSKLSELQQQEAQHAINVEGSLELIRQPTSPKSPTRRRASDVGPMNPQTMPILPTELLKSQWTRQLSSDSICSELPDLADLWGAREPVMMAGSTLSLDFFEGSAGARRPRVLEVAENRCRNLARVLGESIFSGIHFVPRFGAAISLPYELLKFGEEVLEKESEELVMQWKWGDRHHRKDKFYEVPFMILDPDEVDCPIAYMSQGLEDLTGYFRAWALGRHFRFLLLPDALQNRVFNGQEMARIDEFCCNQNKDAPTTPAISTTRVCWDFKESAFLDRSPRSSSPKRKRVGQPPPSKDLDVPCRMLSLLRLFVPKNKSPVWSCFYLRHVWVQDPSILDPTADFCVKHFIFVVVRPLYTQMPALEDLLTMDALETNLELGAHLRKMLLERSHNVALKEREAISTLDTVVPEWLLKNGQGVPSCMVGWHFVARIGLAAVRDFQGSWSRLAKTLFKLNPEPTGTNLVEQSINDEEDGLLCWVADASSWVEDTSTDRKMGLPLVFISQSLQKLTGYSSEFALARNVQLFQPKKQRIDQAINNEEPQRIEAFSSQTRSHGDSMVSLLLLEKRGGSRFFALQQTFYLVEPRSDKGYLLSILNPIELDMPAVLKSHQITELNEDEMGLALEGWAVFLGQQREDPFVKTITDVGIPKACEHYSTQFAAFLRTCEDYVGDLFVPKIGLSEAHVFKQSGELQPLLQIVQEDVRRLLERPDWVGKGTEDVDVVMAVADPMGEDYPLVWISQGFEEQTGYQREWVLGRNCRFLQPKDHDRNERFNGDQLEKLRHFCQASRQSRRPTLTNTFALLLNERRNSSPFWNLSSYLHAEVNGKPFIVSLMLPFREEKVRLAELLSLDPEALAQQQRLKGLLARHEGGAKFTSLEAVVRQLFSVFFDDFPRVLQAPYLAAACGPLRMMPIFGLEVGANNTQAMAGSLKAGLRHVHIVLPSGPTTKATDGSTFVRKILPLKLAEVLNNLQRQHLHYLREAMVITVRTPPHLVFVLAEVRKTLATAGYTVACWFLDVRGCTPADVGEHWKAVSQAKAPTEAVGLFGGNARLFSAVQAVKAAPVSICAVKVHPGKRPDEPEMRLLAKLVSLGILPMAYNVFGPDQSWIRTPHAQSAAARLGITPATLALKWLEHRGFLALVPELQELFKSTEIDDHRWFMHMYREAPSVEICMKVLVATGLGAIPPAANPEEPQEPVAATPRIYRPAPAPEVLPQPSPEPAPLRLQALPDLRQRATKAQPQGIVWDGQPAAKRVISAVPLCLGSPQSNRDCLDGSRDYELPPRPGLQDYSPALSGFQAIGASDGLQKVPLPPGRARSNPRPKGRHKKPKPEMVVVSMASPDMEEETTSEFGYQSLFVSLGTK